MKPQIIQFLYCPFTGLGLRGGYRGDKWLENRIKVFKEYTLASVVNQIPKNFYLWISWRPEERSNPIVQGFMRELAQVRDLSVIHTFGGLCFWDDKYDDEEAGARLLAALKSSLREGQFDKLTEGKTHVMMTIQPSDDMYLAGMVEKLYAKFEELYAKTGKDRIVMGWRKGYIMNYATKEIAEYMSAGWQKDETSEYRTDTIPPFFTIVFPREKFLDAEAHYLYTGPYKSHEYVGDKLEYVTMEGRGFVVGTHGENISTVFNHRYKGRTLNAGERDYVLFATNTFFSETIVIPKKWSLVLRNILNALPFEKSLRKFYHSLPSKYKIL